MKITLYWFGILFLLRKIFVSFVYSSPLEGVGGGSLCALWLKYFNAQYFSTQITQIKQMYTDFYWQILLCMKR